MDIQISFRQRDEHTNQLLAKGWTYKSASGKGMDIQISFLFGIRQGRTCELSTLALDACIVSLLSIMLHCDRAYIYVSMHGRGECTSHLGVSRAQSSEHKTQIKLSSTPRPVELLPMPIMHFGNVLGRVEQNKKRAIHFVPRAIVTSVKFVQ